MDLTNLFLNSPIGIGTINDRKILTVNKYVCDELGYSSSELIGQDSRILYYTDAEYERAGNILYPMLNEKGFGDVETKFKHKNGVPVYIWLRATWLDNNDHSKGQFFTALNFTEQIKARQALRDNDERFFQAGKFAKFGVWEVDLESGRVIADETYRHLMGYSSLDKFETPDDWLQCIVSEQDRRVANILLKKLIRNDIYTLNLEHKARKKDGTVIHAELMAQLIHKDGQQHLLGFSRDISEYNQMREALKTQQEQYRSIIDSTSAILFNADPETLHFDFISNEAESLLGYPIEKYTEQPDFFINHIHPDDRDWVIDLCKKLNSQQLSHNIDYRFIKADGSTLWLHDSVNIIVDENRKARVAGALFDITDQKETEAQLRTLSSVVEQSPDATVLTDENFKITYLNKAFTKLFGYTLDEILGLTPELFCSEEPHEEYLNHLYDSVSQGENIFDVALYKRKDNSTFICQFWISALRDDKNKIIGYMGSQRDITNQIKQEKATKEAEARYRMLYEHIPQGVILFYADGSVITANPAAKRIMGYASNGIQNLLTLNLTQPCIREDGTTIKPQEHPAMVALRKETPVKNKIIGVYNPEKKLYIWINVDAVPLKNQTDGNYDRVFTSFSDITESRKLQQALIKRQRMEAVGQLTGGIAHDFNNILGSILGFTELAKMNYAHVDQKLNNYLEQIEIAGGRARDLIRELMIFSRGETTRSATAQHLVPQVQSIIKLLRPILRSSINVSTEFPEPGPAVEIDPLHLQQLLMNLCVNASEAMNGSGNMVISISNTMTNNEVCDLCNQKVQGEWAEISVTDSGGGISSAVINDLFQPFISTKDIGEGSGMGLAVVKGIMETYNGHCIFNTSSEGSQFRLLLPLASSPA